MKKIMYVIGQLSVGGAERQLVYLASNLDRSRFIPIVCSLSLDSPLRSLLDVSGVESVIIPPSMKPDLTRPFKLYKLVNKYKPDLIHSYLILANTWSKVVGLVAKIPVVLSERSSEMYKPLMFRIINRVLAPMGSALIANSYSGANRVITSKECIASKVRVIYNGIPLEKYNFPLNSENKKNFLHGLGVPVGNRVIGIIGRLDTPKNHELLFDAFKSVKQAIPNSTVLCVGDGPRLPELKKMVTKFGISESVIFAGHRDDIPKLLSAIDVLVLPSKWEGLPNVILEAMASKCPVVATNVGGVSELVSNYSTGLLSSLDDKEMLAEKILEVLFEKVDIFKIKENAYRFVNENFSVRRMVQETEKVYDEVLKN